MIANLMSPLLSPTSLLSRKTVLAAVALLAVAIALPAQALPRMTLLAGSRCSNCHVNPQGSGLRGDLGWYSMNQVGMVTWDKLGLQSLHDIESNTWLDGKLLFGFDSRLQVAKLPTTNETTGEKGYRRLAIPMQSQPSVAFSPQPWLTALASVNLSSLGVEFDPPPYKAYRYPGQSHYEAWLRLQPDYTWPTLRVGMLQPSFGIRHDDHTMLLRADARFPRQPRLAPNWNDLGAEVSYEGVHWLSAEVAAFMPKNLTESANLANAEGVKPKLGTSARVTFWPQWMEEGINSYVGASILRAGAMDMHGLHLGVGKSYWGTFIGELVHTMEETAAGDTKVSMNWMAQVGYPAADWLTLEARYEAANTEEKFGIKTRTYDSDAFVLGAQWFPVPFVELRPEYRLARTKEYTFGQYALQLHLFF